MDSALLLISRDINITNVLVLFDSHQCHENTKLTVDVEAITSFDEMTTYLITRGFKNITLQLQSRYLMFNRFIQPNHKLQAVTNCLTNKTNHCVFVCK